MVGVMRLLVCGGLFVAGYYLGRQAHRLQSSQDQQDATDMPGQSVAGSESGDAAAAEKASGGLGRRRT